MSQESDFDEYVNNNIQNMGRDPIFRSLTLDWLVKAIGHNYAQNFTWMGRPIIQVPQDIYAIQELIWNCKPDLIIETGIAHGGSLIASASMLAMLDYCDAVHASRTLDPQASRRKVVGIDIDIRAHNRIAIESHPMATMISMLQGSSVDESVVAQVHEMSKGYECVMVFLDSNHTHDHVLAELEAYAPLVSTGSYCVVWDTGVEDLPDGFITNRPWGKGNSPKTAVFKYLDLLGVTARVGANGLPLRFEYDRAIEYKLAVTAAPDGFLKRV